MAALKKSTFIKISLAILIIAIIIMAVELYFKHIDNYPQTQDAYLRAHFIKVASLVPGEVQSVNVKNNESVKKGQLLFTLNKVPFELEAAAANAQLQLVRQKLSGAIAAIQAAEEELRKAKIEVGAIENEASRIEGLVKEGDLPKIDAQKAEAKVKAAMATYKAAQYKLLQAKSELGKEKIEDNPAIKEAQAAYQGAEFKLNHSEYKAAVDGVVVNINIHQGDVVGAGEPLFVLIDTDQYWVDANFDEDKIGKLKIGQHATIKIDMYPTLKLQGVIKSIGYSSGTSFSLLPAQNASGNWVKVAQRFPVRIELLSFPKDKVLRIGSSCTVTVDLNSET
jgi:membrane fusion protein (multidrug efflux system)